MGTRRLPIFDDQADPLAERGTVADIATILGISRASVEAMVDTVFDPAGTETTDEPQPEAAVPDAEAAQAQPEPAAESEPGRADAVPGLWSPGPRRVHASAVRRSHGPRRRSARANPLRGGWTIPGNQRPVCKGDHQLKTYRHWTPTLLEGGIAWRSRTGLLRFSPTADCRTAGIPPEPASEPGTTPRAVEANPPLGETESEALLYEPTWWETHMGESAPPPLPHTELRERYREHRAIHTARQRRRPPPF